MPDNNTKPDDASHVYRAYRKQILFILHKILTSNDENLVFCPEGLEDLSEKVSEHLFQSYASIGGNDLRGIYDIIRDPSSSTTYGEVSSGDASDHVAGVYDTTTTTLALYGTGSMDAAIRACSFREPPTHIFTTRNIASITRASCSREKEENHRPEKQALDGHLTFTSKEYR